MQKCRRLFKRIQSIFSKLLQCLWSIKYFWSMCCFLCFWICFAQKDLSAFWVSSDIHSVLYWKVLWPTIHVNIAPVLVECHTLLGRTILIYMHGNVQDLTFTINWHKQHSYIAINIYTTTSIREYSPLKWYWRDIFIWFYLVGLIWATHK